MGLSWHHLVFFVVENMGNGGRFLVSMAENVVESSLLVEILQRYLYMFAARKHSVIMSVNLMFMLDERGVIADRLATRPQRR